MSERRSLVAGDEHISSRLARYLLFDQLNHAYLRWQVEQFEPYLGRRVLEVGVGVGTIVELLGQRDDIFGIDVEEDVLDYTRKRFEGRAGYGFALQDIANVDAEAMSRLRAHHFDTAVCLNVLEHIEDDVGALSNIREVLEPGGHLGLLVPAHPALYGAYDRLDGHFRRYSQAHLRQVIERSGLRVERTYHLNAVGALGWWVQYRLLRRQIHDSGQFSIMNRLLPAVRAIEGRLRPPFGLSLIAICTRPGI